MEDTCIENATPMEKLCFILLDQMRRLEERMDDMTERFREIDRWSLYNLRVARPKKDYFDRLCTILQTMDPLMADRLIRKEFPADTAQILIYWIVTLKTPTDEIVPKILRTEHHVHWGKLCSEELVRSIWRKLPWQEIDKFREW